MNQDLFEFIKSDTPPLNPAIANGLAVTHMERSLEYFDSTAKAVLAELAQTTKLHYEGFEYVSPREEFIELTRGKNNQPRQYNLARTDAYMIRLIFRLEGREEPFTKLVRVPFLTDGSIIHLSGSQYYVCPVLADRVISIVDDKVFVKLVSVKQNYDCFNYNYDIDGVRSTFPVCKSAIYNNPSKRRSKRYNSVTPLVYYLLCKYGLNGLFKRYLECDIIYGRLYKDIDPKDYPSDQYVICTSTGIRPPKLSIPESQYIPCDIALIFKREDFQSNTIKSIVAGLFFILDQFHSELNIEEFDDTGIWKICLGKVLFGYEALYQKIITDINDHLSSVSNYMDSLMIKKFKSIGIEVEDMYHLFFVIIDNFETWQNNFLHKESNLYDKKLSVLYYIMGDLNAQMVNFFYNLKKKLKFGNTIRESDIEDAIRKEIKPDRVSSMNTKHGEFINVEYSGDNKCFGLTLSLCPQEKTTKIKAGNNSIKLDDPTKYADVSQPEVRTSLGMTKAAPDGSTRINPHLQTDEFGGIIRDETLIDILDETQEKLKHI